MAFSQPLSNEFTASDIIYSIWLHFVHFENVGQSKCHFRASNQIKSQTGLKMLHVNMPNRTFGPDHAPLDQKFLLIGTGWLHRSIIRLVCMDTLLKWSLLHMSIRWRTVLWSHLKMYKCKVTFSDIYMGKSTKDALKKHLKYIKSLNIKIKSTNIIF